MKITDHGEWAIYTPDSPPEGMPPNALYARRASDGRDWYQYVSDGGSFRPGTLKVLAGWSTAYEGYVVSSAVRDATTLFPSRHRLLEFDYDGADPQKELALNIIDPKTGAVRPPPAPTSSGLDEIVRRLEALENRDKP